MKIISEIVQKMKEQNFTCIEVNENTIEVTDFNGGPSTKFNVSGIEKGMYSFSGKKISMQEMISLAGSGFEAVSVINNEICLVKF